MATTNTADFYRKPYLTTATFAFGLLLFLLPFFDIKCNNISMAKLKGIDMAIGGKPTVSKELEDMGKGFPGTKDSDETLTKASTTGDAKLFISALIALVLGAIGLVLSLINKGRNQRPTMIVGALGALAMVVSWIEIGSYVSNNVKSQAGNDGGGEFSAMMNVSASPTLWYVLSLLSFLAAAYFSYRKTNTVVAVADEQPPQDAPQVKISNPGDQSEFPSAPESERDLG